MTYFTNFAVLNYLCIPRISHTQFLVYFHNLLLDSLIKFYLYFFTSIFNKLKTLLKKKNISCTLYIKARVIWISGWFQTLGHSMFNLRLGHWTQEPMWRGSYWSNLIQFEQQNNNNSDRNMLNKNFMNHSATQKGKSKSQKKNNWLLLEEANTLTLH